MASSLSRAHNRSAPRRALTKTIVDRCAWIRSSTRSSTAGQIEAYFRSTPHATHLALGKITGQRFYRTAAKDLGFDGGYEEFATIWSDIFTPIGEMVALQDELRERRVPTYIFSNTNELAVAHIRRNFPFFSRFDGYILSYEHGAMKPDARLYEVVENRSRRRAAEILYLDDRAENIAAGAARGWSAAPPCRRGG